VARTNQLVNLAVTPRLCEDPSCVAACSRNALTESEETGEIIVGKEECNGCGWCIKASGYEAIMLHPENKVVYVYDLCKEKVEPQCVKWCPEEALELVTSYVLTQKARITAVKLFQGVMKE
jgi:carbon-monoxide dehydrogenase iron sulfur subunit